MIPMIGQEQPPQFHPEGDVFEHTVLMLNLMNDGQTGKSAPHTTDAEQVEQTFLSALTVEVQTGMSAPHGWKTIRDQKCGWIGFAAARIVVGRASRRGRVFSTIGKKVGLALRAGRTPHRVPTIGKILI